MNNDNCSYFSSKHAQKEFDAALKRVRFVANKKKQKYKLIIKLLFIVYM
jgi:hypothetical protein